MKILVLNEHHRLSPRVETEVETLSEYHDVSVLAWNRTGASLEGDDTVAYIDLAAPVGKLLLLVYTPLLYWRFARRLWRSDFGVLHCTHLMLLPLAVAVGVVKRTKVVYDAYERHAIEISSYFPFSQYVRSMLEWGENQLCKRADLVLTVDTAGDLLVDRYLSVNDNVEVLFNVPSLEDGRVDVEDVIRQQYTDTDVLVYVGGISKAKGVRRMVEAFAEVLEERPNCHLLLIGEFKDGREETFEYVEQEGIKDSIEHVEWLPYDEMMQYLDVADIGLALHQPCRKFRYVSTGTGRKFFTYMQAGLPIVGPEFAEVGQVVRETNCGVLIDTTDTEAVGSVLLDLLENPNEAATMENRGRRAIENRYNWSQESRKLITGYERL